ncbi:MAG: CCA tRNA nucleotidyltransferase [Erysipelotrichales bacterium]|nr:CCA tRNA nucleotidyltransferase [Erysipelotrichales bacterium]
MELLELLKKVTKTFNSHGFFLYAVGGTVRDFLLGKEVKDFDFVTDATPEEMESFLENYNNVFKRFGVMICKFDNTRIEITTLRQETSYKDSRHPDKITFVNNISEDYLRRDFTINALYMDYKGKLYDFCNGLEDLNKKTIRVIGDVDKRMKEDPLRILRAIRFSMILDFELEDNLDTYIQNNIDLLKKLNVEKIKQEITKMMNYDQDKTNVLLNKYKINLFNIN